MKGSKLIYMLLGGVLALGLVFGAASMFAQTEDETPEDEQAVPAVPFENGPRGLGRIDGAADGEALAEALGITVEELQAAQTEARNAMIDQAVVDGYLTEAQAEQLKAYGSGAFGHRGFHFGVYDSDEYLADALGITVEQLDAAKQEVREAQIAAAVEAGYLTQEQADLMLAQQAVQNYIDREGIQAQIQAAYEAAVAQALADGAITQAQADALLAQLEAQSFGFGLHGFGGPGGFGRGGRGHHHGGGFGGPGNFSLPLPDADGSGTDTTPSDSSNTSLDA